MKAIIKQTIINLITLAMIPICRTKIGMFFADVIIDNIVDNKISVKYKGSDFKFFTPNRINMGRALSFATKEPETLDWIDLIDENDVLWDIGANVGLYTVYAARERRCKVIAFEPSVFNLELLAKNIFINDVNEFVTIIPLPLNDKFGINVMRMTTIDWGESLSTFDKNISQDGGPIKDKFQYNIFGLTMDQAVHNLRLSKPDHIKIDVDGIEHFILRGGGNVLSSVKSILIEINDDFTEQLDESTAILTKSGFILSSKLHAPWIEETEYSKVYNQIWIKK